MRWSRIAGLLAAALIALVVLASLGQLGESLFDHGGMLPTLVLLVAFILIAWRLGIGQSGIATNPYW